MTNGIISLNLLKQYQRPVVVLRQMSNIYALLDTGALFPVWTADEKLLRNMGATLIKESVEFGGFGGRTNGNLYRMKKIEIGGLRYPDLPIVCCNDLDSIPCHMILSATMLKGLIYTVDDVNHVLNITIPDGESYERRLKIVDSKGHLHVLLET